MVPQANALLNKDDITAMRREAGAWVRARREAAGLSQRDLANKVGLEHYTFISQIEAGRGRVPADRYEAYALALGVEPRDFAMTMLRFHEPHTYRLLFPDAAVPAETAQDKSVIADLAARLARLESKLDKR